MGDQKTNGKMKTQYKVLESHETPGEWRVEAVRQNGESEICSTVFFGPDAKSRAEEYADWRSESEETDPTASEIDISLGAYFERRRIAKYLRDAADHQEKQGNSDETVALLRAAFDVLTGNIQETAELTPVPVAAEA